MVNETCRLIALSLTCPKCRLHCTAHKNCQRSDELPGADRMTTGYDQHHPTSRREPASTFPCNLVPGFSQLPTSFSGTSQETTVRGQTARQATDTSSLENRIEKQWRAAVDDLLEIRRLESNWDGEGAVAPVPELVDAAIKIVKQRMHGLPPSRIVPVNDGSISLEWEFGGGYFMSLRVETPCEGQHMLVRPNGATEFGRVNWAGGVR